MITLNINVPNVAQVIAAGFTSIQLQKSSTQQQSGSYADVLGASAPLQSTTTTYTLLDVNGNAGDWYTVVYTINGASPSQPGVAMPGYLSDLANAVRDLIGVTSLEVPDATLQEWTLLPAALTTCRARLASASLVFDSVVAAGGDAATNALSALAHLLAARVCQRMKVQVADSEQMGQYRIQRNRQMDWSQTATELTATYEWLIAQAAGDSATKALSYLSGVALAGPTRGGYDTSGSLITLNGGYAPNGDTPLPNNLPAPNDGIISG